MQANAQGLTATRGRSAQLTIIWLAVGVVVWRIAAAANVSSSPLLGEEPSQAEVGLLLARGLMGMVFVVCGTLAFLRSTHPARILFALYALGAGLHWGGPIGSSWPLLRTATVLFYLTVSGMLAQSLFLHFALAYPRNGKAATARWGKLALYSPVAVGAVLGVVVVAFFEAPSIGNVAQSAFLVLHHLQSNLFGLAALVVILVRWFKASAGERAGFGLGLIALGAWGGLLPWGMALLLGKEELADHLTLLFVLIPISFCAALDKVRAPEAG